MTVLYHNPRCSKSRCCAEYLRSKQIAYTIVKYLEEPLTVAELTNIVRLLGIHPEELIRKNEDLYKSEYKGKTFTDAEWIEIMLKNPILIERPIVVHGNKAVVARPAERVDEIL